MESDTEDASTSGSAAGPSNSIMDSDSTSHEAKRIRMDWKPSWKDKYLVDFDPSSRKMICMVCHLRMVCVRSDTVSKHFKRAHKDMKMYSATEKTTIQLKYSREKSNTKKGCQTLKRWFHWLPIDWHMYLHSTRSLSVIVKCVSSLRLLLILIVTLNNCHVAIALLYAV